MISLVKNISAKKGYRYLLLKLLGFLLIAYILDLVIGKTFKYFYFRQKSGWEYKTKYSIEDTKADILIFGASRAQQQYNPDFFEERLKQTCYNVGRDGEPIFYYYGVLKGVLSRHKPKVIILDVENGVFKESQSSYDRIAALLPFYEGHPEMRPIIELRSPFEKLKLQSHIYPYNSLLFKIAIGNTGFNKKHNEDIKGYVPLRRALTGPIRTVDLSEKYNIDTVKVNLYRAFISDCARANVKLYLVCSPYFIDAVGNDTSMVLARKIASKENIDFIDFSKDPLFLKSPRLFDDTVHVNFAGSAIFSNQLIDTILSRNQISPITN